jgi:lipoic acid synthetase
MQQLERKPEWLKVRAPGGASYTRLVGLRRDLKLHTVCEEAHCPNMGECWNQGTATFMILGDTCTRSCGFCAVKTGRPTWLDEMEPQRVAKAISHLGLRHAVITSVNRDELPDGGSKIFARTIAETRKLCPKTSIEVLIPDFKGDETALRTVMEERPDILNHNLETVPRLYTTVRPQAKYPRSLEVLKRAKAMAPGTVTKSGIMVGLGEELDEVVELMTDLRQVDCDVMTIGQYLRPSLDHLPVARFVKPEEFQWLKEIGESMGFRHVESGPLVRSSYHAAGQVELKAEGTEEVKR